MDVAVYVRISRDLTGAAAGVKRQEQLCRELAEARGWRVVEVDVSYRRRTLGGVSKVSGSVRGTLRVLQDFTAVLRRRWRGAPSSELASGDEPLS